MKILHVVQGIDPLGGGPAYAVRKTVHELAERGNEVSLIATSIHCATSELSEDQYVERTLADDHLAGVEVFLGSVLGRFGLGLTYGYSPACSRWLRRRFADVQRAPEVVHIHGTFSYLTSIAAAYSRRAGVPYIIQPMGSLDSDCLELGHRRIKRLFHHVFLKRELRFASCVEACSGKEARELLRWVSAEKIVTTPHGVDIPVFDRADAARRFLAKHTNLAGKRLILFLSRVASIKRPELLVAAMARLRADYPNLVLLVVGPDSGHLAALRDVVAAYGLADAVVFTGFLAGHEKQCAYAVADLYALPSLHENFGIAAVEAMAHAVPVLVTRGVASHVYVDQSGGGVTVDDNVEAIAEGMRRLLNGDRDAMGQRGRAFVQEHLAWSDVARALESLYQSVASRAKQNRESQ